MFLVIGTSVALSLMSCIGQSQSASDDVDSVGQEIDSVAAAPIEVTGVAIDGAMNSVYLKLGDDTVEFSYPDLDSEHRASWAINDTLTIRYYVTQDGDSVTDVINHADA